MTDSPNLALAEEIDAFDFEGWDVSTRELLKLSSLLARAAALLRAQPSGDWVMVPRDAMEGFQRMVQRQLGHKNENDITPARAIELARIMLLSAAKERGRV